MVARFAVVLMMVLASFVGRASVVDAQLVDSPWPMFMHDQRHSGQATVAGPATSNTVKRKWLYKASGGVLKPQPALGPGGTTVYSGTAKKPLCAFDADTGAVKWCIKGDNANSSSPAIGLSHAPFHTLDHTIYNGARDNRLHAVYPNGTEIWKYSMNSDGDIKSPSVIGSDGTIYTACGCLSDSYLHAINPDGTAKWILHLTHGGTANIGPAIGDNGRIYMANVTHLFAIDDTGTAGHIVWSVALPGGKNDNSSPSVYTDDAGNRYIYIGSAGGLSKFEDTGNCATCGVLIGTVTTNGVVDTTAAITNTGLVLFSSWTTKPKGTSTLYATDLALKTYWTPISGRAVSLLDHQRPSLVVDKDGMIYAALGLWVYAFHPSAGPWSVKWQFQFPRDAFTISLGDGVLYVASLDGTLSALVPDP